MTLLRRLLVALAALLGVLIVTGIYLSFRYRPAGAVVWNDLESARDTLGMVSVVQTTHRLAAFTFVATAVATAIVAFLTLVRNQWQIRTLAAFIAILAVALVYTGYLLPWDQLALWAVTVGTDQHGYTVLFDNDVKFVLLGSEEIGVDTLRRRFLVHTVVLPLVLLAVGGAFAWLTGRRERQLTSPAA